jgi:phospholipid/cholesterol/gamma-HCH transport system substrate-binding protein
VTARPSRLVVGVVGLALAGAVAGCGAFSGEEVKTLTASFDRAVGLYEKSDVRVLGVRIGEVTEITPDGDDVRVEMQYDAKYDIPADAKAVVVAPSIVSDRYVQLTPVFTGGQELEDGAVLAKDRTAVPVELDQIYAALDQLNVALGPNGANKDGALSDAVSVGAENLKGNGQLLGTTLEDFATFVTTLSEQREDLFGTIANLQDFTTTIANSDQTVRAFNRDLAQVADQLEGEREDLARAVRELSVALGEVATFVRDNREDLKANVTNLRAATDAIVKQQNALKEFIDVAPTGLSNLQLAYNPSTGTLDTRDNNIEGLESDPLFQVCRIIESLGQQIPECEGVAEAVPFPPGSAPAPAPAPAPQAPAPRDMTLGGILDGGR